MAHKHPVYDTDKHFVIDPITKKISTECPKVVLAQHSHRSERFTFELPKEVEGHDMSLCNVVEIHFQNIEAANKSNKNIGIYKVDDLQTEGDTVFGSWLIDGESTYYVGGLMFALHFACVADDGTVEYNLPTLSYSAITIGETVWNSETIAKEHPDIIAEFEARIAALEKGGATDEQIAQAVSAYLDENPVQGGATAEQAAQITQNKNDIANLKTEKLSTSELNNAINTALAQAKASGEFDGADGADGQDGNDYVLTEADKAEIAEQAAALVDVPEPSGGGLTAEQIAALDGMFKVAAYDTSKDYSGAYAAFKTAFGITEEEPDEPDDPVVPDEPDVPEVTLSSISATYSGGDVAVGTSVTDLTGIVVTAHYSDGTSETVTGYTLSGTIAEGSNTITVSYGGMTTTFTVTGVAESIGGEVIETLSIVPTTSYPKSATFAYEVVESPSQYIVARQEATTGGKLNFSFDPDDASCIAAVIFLFKDDEPYKIYSASGSGKDVTGNLNEQFNELEVGNTSWVFGDIMSPAVFTIPEGCKIMISMRRGTATSANGAFDSNATFAQWAINNLKLTITN